MNAAMEYLHTDGRGGFFCGTFSGEITRRWHGWWAAENPPRGRKRLIAGFDLRLTYEGKDYWLTRRWENGRWIEADVAFPERVFHWQDNAFGALDLGVRTCSSSGGIVFSFSPNLRDSKGSAVLRIRLLLPNDVDTGVINYVVGNAATAISPHALETLDDVSLEIEKDCEKTWSETLKRESGLSIPFGRDAFEVRIQAVGAGTVEEKPPSNGNAPIRINRRWSPSHGAHLSLAADQFIARGKGGSTTILAGYPWFTDWGRDAMISIPGLCIATGRIAEARGIVRHFLEYTSQGLIPNIFPEHGEQPRYNTVDATLWLVDVIFRLWPLDEIAGDMQLCTKLREIIEWHERGTHNNIRVAGDGLLIGGDAGTQLTWMDVKVNGHVPTPRHGKPVEIQGLWFNALQLIGMLAKALGDGSLAKRCGDLSTRVADAFARRFIDHRKVHLADVVDRDGAGSADWSLRPNMVIPFALHHNVIPATKRTDVLRAIAEDLLTPRGLRTLGPQEPKYHGIYHGDVVVRDHAYHQGTVWMWLLAPYFAGVIAEKEKLPDLYAALSSLAEELIFHFDHEGCLHQCNEIFDADPPHVPRGCFAQAWSTAALIQILQYDLD
ncbi:glycogen debranching enzyme N-terminal domain-containing protein [Candidatus Sumerlaeota bacterium]|nr:glycogen debranching enzyme N-terminal domain-containing protein [Candidatus Sumerlaeota bacterium]